MVRNRKEQLKELRTEYREDLEIRYILSGT